LRGWTGWWRITSSESEPGHPRRADDKLARMAKGRLARDARS
jgi:hypothetical protein